MTGRELRPILPPSLQVLGQAVSLDAVNAVDPLANISSPPLALASCLGPESLRCTSIPNSVHGAGQGAPVTSFGCRDPSSEAEDSTNKGIEAIPAQFGMNLRPSGPRVGNPTVPVGQGGECGPSQGMEPGQCGGLWMRWRGCAPSSSLRAKPNLFVALWQATFLPSLH